MKLNHSVADMELAGEERRIDRQEKLHQSRHTIKFMEDYVKENKGTQSMNMKMMDRILTVRILVQESELVVHTSVSACIVEP
ncbi:hypothetical protein TNCV_389821 [Trichonephila clavipes]|nr:hypothetical protein TNCV_389821 [Trichonephila clavipes]